MWLSVREAIAVGWPSHLDRANSNAICSSQLVCNQGPLPQKVTAAQPCKLDLLACYMFWHTNLDLQSRKTRFRQLCCCASKEMTSVAKDRAFTSP